MSLPSKMWLKNKSWYFLFKRQHYDVRSHIFFGYFGEREKIWLPHQQVLVLVFANRFERKSVQGHKHHLPLQSHFSKKFHLWSGKRIWSFSTYIDVFWSSTKHLKTLNCISGSSFTYLWKEQSPHCYQLVKEACIHLLIYLMDVLSP